MEEESNDPMFVIKNLDTGLQMRIDDFDKIANLATDEQQEQEHAHKKGGLNFKGSKAIKNWTAATTKKASAAAKKAVSGIKDVAQELKHELQHELNVPHVLSKHKTGRTLESSSSKASSSSGLQPSASGASELQLQRATTTDESQTLDPALGASAGSMSSLAASEQSTISSEAYKQLQLTAQTANGTDAATQLPALADTTPLTVSDTGAAAAPTPSGHPAAASTAVPTAAAVAAPPGPAVPAAVRLVSHKHSSNPVREVVLAQVLDGSCGVVWAAAFSRDGSFLATAGQDGVLRVWQLTASRYKEPRTNWVYSTPGAVESKRRSSTDTSCEQPQQQQQQQQLNMATSEPQQQQQDAVEPFGDAAHHHEHMQESGRASAQLDQQSGSSEQQHHPQLENLSCQGTQQEQQQQHTDSPQEQPPIVEYGLYFSRQPVRVFTGHTEDILDVTWSAGGFILTASLDKSVRLWHVSQPDCLREFWHTDFVTSVQFHPLDAQRFVSGSIDGKIRVWSITANTVLATAQLHQDMVTAVAFSLNGGRVMAGTMRGRCRFYELADKKLEYVAQVDVRNQRGAHASGKKVTGICAVPGQPQQFLVTTNDSRLRLLEGYGQVLKFKGHKNVCTQLRASMTTDGANVACGSDDGWVYVWQTGVQEGGHAGAAATGYQQHRNPGGAHQQQQMGGKNALYQAYQAHEAGVPVTAVAFAPAAAYEGGVSVLCSSRAANVLASVGISSSSASAVGTAAEGQLAPVAEGAVDSVPSIASRRKVQQLIVSGAFNGAVRVHELL